MFCSRYDHQTKKEANISYTRVCALISLFHVLHCSHVCDLVMFAFDFVSEAGALEALLFLDQIKPIEQLVPVN